MSSLHAQGIPDDYIEYYLKKITERGYQYDDHCAAIVSWWQKDKHRWGARASERTGSEVESSNFETDDFFEAALRRSYGDKYNEIYGK